ncbi:hypothetical protein [Streptomyces parvulus]|uniref:hypothetical protein n=1 Tax=Streptomyces parvulus TaxID=146923 RepID=UPI00379D0B5A
MEHSAVGQSHEELSLYVVPPRTHLGARNEGGQGSAPTQHTTRRHARNQRRQLLDPLLQHGWICHSFKWGGLALRSDKLALTYQAALHLAAILLWARR